MARQRSNERFNTNVWPGFVDAMTGLLLVLMFVLSIFTVVQFVLRTEITGKEEEVDRLSTDISSLTAALGLARTQASNLETELGSARSTIDTLGLSLAERDGQISDFEARVAALLAAQAQDAERISSLEGSEASLTNALASARTEIDAQEEAARLAAAEREAIEALLADLRSKSEAEGVRLTELEEQRLIEAEAARALRERLEQSDAELTAMTLALEAQRREAEETLTLLAAARAAQETLTAEAKARSEALSDAEKNAVLLALAQEELSAKEALSAESQRQMEVLNQQVAELRSQIGGLQEMLNLAKVNDESNQVQIQSLGTELNTALARVAAEERRARDLEEAERIRLEAEAKRLAEEAKSLEQYKSEFFGQLRSLLATQEGVRIVGDRFVFSSEVLFDPGSANLSMLGEQEISKVAEILHRIANEIPAGLDWVIRVDGHTDNNPLSGSGEFSDNWELSQARALSVVRYMINAEGIPANRLAANGFGEFQPINPANTPEARAQNRRIELKLTER